MAHTMDCWSRRPPRIRASLLLAACCAVASGLAVARGGTGRADLVNARRDPGDGGMLLVEYFRLLIADQDFEAFRGRVAAQYSEETLCRLLSDTPGITTRRASAAALGSLGGFRRSNPVLARASATPTRSCGTSPKAPSGRSGSGPTRPRTTGRSSR